MMNFTKEQGLKVAGNIGGLMQLLSASTGQQAPEQHNTEDDNNAALDFADSL